MCRRGGAEPWNDDAHPKPIDAVQKTNTVLLKKTPVDKFTLHAQIELLEQDQ
jgi:hypothetical protein